MDIEIDNNKYQEQLRVHVNYTLDLSLIGWIPGIPNAPKTLTQTAHAAIEVGHTGVNGTICTWNQP